MITKRGWAKKIMFGAFKKEATYDAGVTMIDANACSMRSFKAAVKHPDVIVNDKDLITTYEHGQGQELVSKRVEISYSADMCRPNSLAFIASLCMGSSTPTQDGSFTAYKHRIVPVAVGSALPSTQAEYDLAGVQEYARGIKGKSFKLSGEEGKAFALSAELIGSGTRATSATAFAAPITENWLFTKNCKVWLASGADISIDATLAQGTESISTGGSPAALSARIKKMDFSWDNAPEPQEGFGGSGVYVDIDKGTRKADLSLTLLHSDATELGYYDNQTVLAIEFDCKQTLIAAGGAVYYGFHLIVPRFILKERPLPEAERNGAYTFSLNGDIYDDGVNAPVIMEVYTAKPAYLAA